MEVMRFFQACGCFRAQPKLKFQLAFWASNSQNLLAKAHAPLVQNSDIRQKFVSKRKEILHCFNWKSFLGVLLCYVSLLIV